MGKKAEKSEYEMQRITEKFLQKMNKKFQNCEIYGTLEKNNVRLP